MQIKISQIQKKHLPYCNAYLSRKQVTNFLKTNNKGESIKDGHTKSRKINPPPLLSVKCPNIRTGSRVPWSRVRRWLVRAWIPLTAIFAGIPRVDKCLWRSVFSFHFYISSRFIYDMRALISMMELLVWLLKLEIKPFRCAMMLAIVEWCVTVCASRKILPLEPWNWPNLILFDRVCLFLNRYYCIF